MAPPATENQETSSSQTIPPPPSSKEQQAQAEAYRNSSQDLDRQVEQSGHSAKELEMTFERFMASLYMTAMMQLGLMHSKADSLKLTSSARARRLTRSPFSRTKQRET